MPIRCKNGSEHLHETVAQVKLCWHAKYVTVANVAGGPPVPPPRAVPPVTPVPVPAPVSVAPVPAPVPTPVPTTPSVPMVSPGQLSYIRDLDGDTVHASKLTYNDASDYIERLKAQKYGGRRSYVSNDPRLKMATGMIDMVPDGYYATAPDGPGGHVDFMRITRPTRGKFKGCVKVQTQHSDLWREVIVGWPSGKWSVYRQPAIDTLLLVIADHATCAWRYSIEVQSCCICNRTLTDDRSRHYLVGPVCDKKPYGEQMLARVDEINGMLTYEELLRSGLPTRVWQDKAVL